MLLPSWIQDYPCKAKEKWVQDIGNLDDNQWDNALESVLTSSLNSTQRLSQLYIIIRSHFTPIKLYRIGALQSPLCAKCRTSQGDHTHLIWRCKKLPWYWVKILETLEKVFHTNILLRPNYCILGILDDLDLTDFQKVAINRALFQAWKLILPPTYREWVTHMGDTHQLEKVIIQHRGCPGKFEKLWGDWLSVPGFSAIDLVTDRILGWLAFMPPPPLCSSYHLVWQRLSWGATATLWPS